MKWVKASEQQPTKTQFAIKIIDSPVVYSTGRFLKNQQQIEDILNGNYYPLEQIEWLDEKELSISESNEKLNEYANKMKLEFSKPQDFGLGWRLCFDWMMND